MSADDRTEALARQWQAECSTAAERATLALLHKDRRSLDAVLATHTAAQLAAVQRPLPLYHAAALGDWTEGIAALAAAGVPPSTADALVQVEADSPLAELLSKMTNAFVYPVGRNSGSDSDSDEGIMWAPGGFFSAVGLAAAMGHREAAAALLAIGASATAARTWCSLPAARAAMVNEERGRVPPGTTQALLSLLAAAGGQLSPSQVADFVLSLRYMGRVAIPLLLRQLVARRASLASLSRDALQALASAALYWDCAEFFELLPAGFVAEYLPGAAARDKPVVLLCLLRLLGRPLACPASTQQLALSTALNAKQLASAAALLAAGALPTAVHISQAICSCQPNALRALLAVAHPPEPPVQFGTIDVTSAEFASALPSFVHQALLVAAQDTQQGNAHKWLQVLETLQSAGYRLLPYRGVTVRLPGGWERRYERYDPAADDARTSAAAAMGHLRLAVSRPPWSPDIHSRFPPAFRRACRALLLAARRSGGTMQLPGAVASGVFGLQPPAHLGSLPADALLLIMQQAAYPLSLWAGLDCIQPAAPSGMAADVADAVAAFKAALGGDASAGCSAASAAGPPAPDRGTGEAPAVPTPDQLSQGLAALSFSTHSGPFVFGGSG